VWLRVSIPPGPTQDDQQNCISIGAATTGSEWQSRDSHQTAGSINSATGFATWHSGSHPNIARTRGEPRLAATRSKKMTVSFGAFLAERTAQAFARDRFIVAAAHREDRSREMLFEPQEAIHFPN
jgi:hypothetical protein